MILPIYKVIKLFPNKDYQSVRLVKINQNNCEIMLTGAAIEWNFHTFRKKETTGSPCRTGRPGYRAISGTS